MCLDGAHINLLNNVISNNTYAGIVVAENSSAHIGFATYYDTVASPNIIGPNSSAVGILVTSSSNAKIIGNTINDNSGSGILVDRVSQADIVANAINGNLFAGVQVSRNSAVTLSYLNDYPKPAIYTPPNSTDEASLNQGFGIFCYSGGNVAGYMGSLAGVRGTNYFDSSCVNDLAVSPNSLIGTWIETGCTGNTDICPGTTTAQVTFIKTGKGIIKDPSSKGFVWSLAGLELMTISKYTDYGPITWTDSTHFSWTYEEVGQASGSATITFKHK